VIAKYEELDAKASDSKDYFAVLYDLAPIVRATRNMHQALQQARDSVPDDREILNFRDRAYRVERNAELLYGDAKMSLEFLIAQQSEEQAESSQQMAIASHRLNVLAAFFFPLATLAAIFGVNLELGLEHVKSVSQIGIDTVPGQPFMIMLVIALLLGFVLKSFVTRGKSP
jgi:Mg2+ and Co2+ transporter CorA